MGAGDSGHLLQHGLDTIFGTGWQHILTATMGTSIIGPILSTLNTVSLYGVALIVVAVWILGATHTAYEGVTLGKGLHTIYTPVRMAFSISLVTPLPWLKGICLVQGAVIMLVGGGFWAANQTLGAAVDYMADHAGATQPAPQWATKVVPVAQGLSRTATMFYFLQTDDPHSTPIVTSPTWHAYKTDDDKGSSWAGALKQVATSAMGFSIIPQAIYSLTTAAATSTAGNEMQLDSPKAAGYYSVNYYVQASDYAHTKIFVGGIKIPCAKRDSTICKVRVFATQRLATSIRAARCDDAVVLAGNPRGCTAGNTIPPGAAVADYIKDMEAVAVATANNQISGLKSHLHMQAERMKSMGWLMLGSWYWTFVNAQRVFDAASNMYPSYVAPEMRRVYAAAYDDDALHHALGDSGNQSLHDFSAMGLRDYIAGTGKVASKPSEQAKKNQDANQGAALKELMGKVKGWISKPFLRWTQAAGGLLGEGEPLVHLSGMGQILLGGGEAIMTAYAGAVLIGGDHVSGAVGPFVWGITTMMIVVGASLAYYLPLIPWIMWTIAIIAYLVLIAEMVILAPVWAAAHALPGGEGFAHQRTLAGYLLILDLFFRPVLMVCAFFFAFLIMHLVGWFIAAGFVGASTGMTQGEFVGPIASLSMIIILVGLFIWSSHYVFSMVAQTPDRLQKLLGGEHGIAARTVDSGHNYVGGMVGKGSSRTEQKLGDAHGMAHGAARGLGKGLRGGGHTPAGYGDVDGPTGGGEGGGGASRPAKDMSNAESPNDKGVGGD